MASEEIQERNKQIALMLGWYHEDYIWKMLKPFRDGFISETKDVELQFHTDWNWLMEAIEFINKTHKENNPYRDLHYTIGYLLHGGWWGDNRIPERLLSDKTQLFLAVSDFAKLYNEEKI